MTAKSAHRPFRPGRSRHAEWPDGSFVRCGICGAWLELRTTVPVIETLNSRSVRRWDYQCADHAPFGGHSYYEAAEPGVAAA